MAFVELTAHLTSRFPELGTEPRETQAKSLAELVAELERDVPGLAFYLCDELGRLRRHVNVFIDGELLMDRQRLGDPLAPGSRVFIAQALSGG